MAITRTQIKNRLRRIRGERVRVIKAPRYPQRLENEYRRGILRMVAVSRREVNAFLRADLATIVARSREDQPGVRFDAIEDDREEIMARIRNAFALGFSIQAMIELPNRILTQLDERLFDRMQAQLRRALGQEILNTPQARQLLRAAITANADKISTIPARSLSEIETLVDNALRRGLSSRALAEQIRARLGVAASRAEFIAVDQLTTARADLIRIRRQEAGLHNYRWRDSRDGNVRSGHRRLHDTIQDYRNPPVADSSGNRANPGEQPRCRCEADAVITQGR